MPYVEVEKNCLPYFTVFAFSWQLLLRVQMCKEWQTYKQKRGTFVQRRGSAQKTPYRVKG